MERIIGKFHLSAPALRSPYSSDTVIRAYLSCCEYANIFRVLLSSVERAVASVSSGTPPRNFRRSQFCDVVTRLDLERKAEIFKQRIRLDLRVNVPACHSCDFSIFKMKNKNGKKRRGRKKGQRNFKSVKERKSSTQHFFSFCL